MKVRVADGTQVKHAGTVHAAGDTFDAPAAEMAEALARGWVVPVEDKSKRKR